MSLNKELNPTVRFLMGPGPSDVHPRVLKAMATPLVGHLDPQFIEIMDGVKDMLRGLFRTKNDLTFVVSATGSAGMETCFVNLLEPGDEALVCVNGVFGTRMSDIVNRIGGKLIRVDCEWGRTIDPEAVKNAIKGRDPKIVAVVHAETSTGVCQPLEDLADITHNAGALFLVDSVTSLGGMDVALDKMRIDAAYSGTQKCISCPPGLSPISFSTAAIQKLDARKNPVVSWYLDMSMVRDYWGSERKYHHTAPINMIFGFREALRLIAEEGLENRFERHKLNHRALVAGIEGMGLSMLVPEAERLPMLNAVCIPDGADDLKVRKALLNDFSIEIGGGLGAFAGKIWRVGLMGHTSRRKNIFLFLSALETVLKAENVNIKDGALEAAAAVYA